MEDKKEQDLPVSEQIRFRRRALEAEAKLSELERIFDSAMGELSAMETKLGEARSAYQRIFDEKAERCKYIVELEAKLLASMTEANNLRVELLVEKQK